MVTLKLWEKAGRPKIVWYNTTHMGLALYVNKVIEEVVAFICGEGTVTRTVPAGTSVEMTMVGAHPDE